MPCLLGGLIHHKNVVHGRMKSGFLYPQARRGVSLRVEIDKEGRATGEGKSGGNIDSGSGFPDAAFLVNDRDRSRDAQSPRLGVEFLGRIILQAVLGDVFHVKRRLVLACSTWNLAATVGTISGYVRTKKANLRVSLGHTPGTFTHWPAGSRCSLGGPEAITTPPGRTRWTPIPNR